MYAYSGCVGDEEKVKGMKAGTVVKNVLQRRIGAVDDQIDTLVYELYGLTEEEIGIVEGLV